ncbi:uncharacterized protein Dwil_GK15008 [Drosophila willistoni]|uniref:tRNA-intron lyase n=1 Tax=Drosophila willistoni TaxID=7260 RepID=B4MVR6_DROWI|nr:tRNA-splicing endonuclease subunit Sen2-1 [Drosophila willistoni]EDW75786.1 uncharacterized protein Dwil_GK15008 [Drosophila willistoni]
MEFKVQCKRKRSHFKNNDAAPLPLPEEGLQYEGVFTGLSVDVTQPDQVKSLYDNGCFGKGSKSRGGPESGDPDESLRLGLEEACFLAYFLNVLQIKDLEGKVIEWNDFLNFSRELNERFMEHLAAYVYLKSKYWVIKSGIKFGGDFLIYKQSPRHFHASFLVLIQRPNEKNHFLAKNLKGVQRVAETSDKDVLLLSIEQSTDGESKTPENPSEAIEDMCIQETVVRRFNYSSFVQSKRQKKNN